MTLPGVSAKKLEYNDGKNRIYGNKSGRGKYEMILQFENTKLSHEFMEELSVHVNSRILLKFFGDFHKFMIRSLDLPEYAHMVEWLYMRGVIDKTSFKNY